MAADVPKPPAPSDGDMPEKYFRTFAGDMDALQKGGTPGLAPLEGAPAPDGQSAEASFPSPAEKFAAPPPANPHAEVADRALGEPTEAAVSRPAPSMGSVTPLKTYSGDFSDRMKETHASAATVLAAEQDSGPRESVTAPERPPRTGWPYIIAGGILLVAGIVGAYFAYAHYAASLAPVALAPVASAPIFVDEQQEISGSGAALLKAVVQSSASPITGNAVRLLYMASTTESIFSQLPLSAPFILVRNVSADGSMAGIVNVNGVQSPFFILSVSSYSDTFAGMLAWETQMQRSLDPLFPAYPPLFVATTTTTKAGEATTTAVLVSTTRPGFRDEVVSNHDVRVYRDPAGRVLLLYGYWNPSTLVIARDAASFTEILGRLANSRAKL